MNGISSEISRGLLAGAPASKLMLEKISSFRNNKEQKSEAHVETPISKKPTSTGISQWVDGSGKEYF